MPNDADRTVGIASVTTRRPPGSTVRRTRPPWASVSRVRVDPTRCSAAGSRLPARRAAVELRALNEESALVGAGTGLVVLDDRDQRQLAAVVDLLDLDLDLLAD